MKNLLISLVATSISSLSIANEHNSVFDGAIYTSSGKVIAQASFRQLPADGKIRKLIDKNETHAYRVTWVCPLRGNWKLDNCQVVRSYPQAIPKGISELVNHIKVDRFSLDEANVGHVNITINAILDSKDRMLDRSCPPDWCPKIPVPSIGKAAATQLK